MSDPVWVTPAGLLGTYTALYDIVPFNVQATPQLPATGILYRLYNGLLPKGLTLAPNGVISGIPSYLSNPNESITEFSIQATDNYNNSTVRTFSIEIINPSPVYLVPADFNGSLGTFTSFNLLEAKLNAVQIYPATSITYKLLSGSLPEGVSLSTIQNHSAKIVTATQTVGGTNSYIICNSTTGLSAGRPITFTGTTFGGVVANKIYYVKEVISDTIFSISALPDGIKYILSSATGSMTGTLPATFSCLISGIPSENISTKTYKFVVRATDNLGNISDIGVYIDINGNLVPSFTTSAGFIFESQDSIWVEYPIQYTNPDPTNIVRFTIANGNLPPGLEINEAGLIRGYPKPPVVETNLTAFNGVATSTAYGTNEISCLTTDGFLPGRPILFLGPTLGGLIVGKTYYVREVKSITQFTVSENINGTPVILNNASGLMNFTLPQTTQGEATIKLYNFTLKINSQQGSTLRSFSIRIINQNAPVSQGGPGKLTGTRVPVVYNTRPFQYNIETDVANYGFYILPPPTEYGVGRTYPITVEAPVGTVLSDNFFAFKILGNDFDNQELEYQFIIPPELGLVGDPTTGWIRGYPYIALNQIQPFSFSAAVRKKNNPSIISQYTEFNVIVANNINSTITWLTNSDLGKIYNGVESTISLAAICDVDLNYIIVDGELPNNLTLLPNGEIVGKVAFESTNDYQSKNNETVYTFTVNAFSSISPNIITKTKTFTLTVVQEFIKPTDTIYIECTPGLADRKLIYNLLNDTTLIPNEYLYRPDDANFGKATNVTYVHAYGIHASNLNEYIQAIQKNHYWRNITLGEIKTAYAKNDAGEIIYEVVYSEVIDNLMSPTIETVYAGNFIPGQTYTIKTPGTTKWTQIGAANNNVGTTFTATGKGTGTGSATTVTDIVSVSEVIYWPRFIDLNLGPWYTSITDIYTSYIYPVELDLVTQDNIFYITTQENQNLATNQGQPTFFTSLTPGYARALYPNSLHNMRRRVEQNLGVDTNAALLPGWMTSQQINGNTLGFTPAWVICYTKPGYSNTVKNNIVENWKDPVGNNLQLNLINFQIDRITVNKSMTYDYDNTFSPAAWESLPSATPVPNPTNSKDFNVLFPQKTILPNKPQLDM